MRLRIGTVILGVIFFRALGSICGGALGRGGHQPFSSVGTYEDLVQGCFKPSVLRHVQASAHGFGPSPVVTSELLGSFSDSPTLAPFSLVLSRTAP